MSFVFGSVLKKMMAGIASHCESIMMLASTLATFLSSLPEAFKPVQDVPIARDSQERRMCAVRAARVATGQETDIATACREAMIRLNARDGNHHGDESGQYSSEVVREALGSVEVILSNHACSV